MRYFTLATLFAFVAVAAVLVVLQRGEQAFFAEAQSGQTELFARAQQALSDQHRDAARKSLLAVHQSSHVMLTRVVANMMWDSDIAPFLERARRLPIEPCRALADAGASAPSPRRACIAALGRAIRALPGFAALDAKAYAAMRDTSVFKVKVWDLRGVTVYSSEHAQIGEDGQANQGWRHAVAGTPASELTHRDRFSAFEGVVEQRDLISTYVPVRAGDGGGVLGVLELYSDVTPLLIQMKAAAQRFESITAANRVSVEHRAQVNQRRVDASSNQFLVIVIGLLALLYGVSLLIVRNGQRLIDRHRREREEAARREASWHREKMAALATMAANVSHEVGNPLAIIAGIAQELPDGDASPGQELPAAKRILVQTARVAAMVRRISNFAGAHGDQPEWVDVNAMLKALCDFHAFDRRYRATPVDFRPDPGLPACQLVPDHFNEAVMNLLQGLAEARPQRRLQVQTEAGGAGVRIRAGCSADDADSAQLRAAFDGDVRLQSVRRRVVDMGGRLSVEGGCVQIELPVGADEPH